MAERVIADHKVTCSNQVTSLKANFVSTYFWVGHTSHLSIPLSLYIILMTITKYIHYHILLSIILIFLISPPPTFSEHLRRVCKQIS